MSYRSPMRTEARRLAKVSYGRYRCRICAKEYGPRDVQVDHILPVVPVTGWDSFDGYIERLFCPKEFLQLLCKACHSIKSKEENSRRKRAGK